MSRKRQIVEVDGSGLTSIEDLRPAPYNPRRISKYAAKALSRSLEKFGDISGIVWNKRTGNLVCGHQRVEELRGMGASFVDGSVVAPNGECFRVRIVNWDDTQERAANIVANNPHIAGEFTDDVELLMSEILAGIGREDFVDLALDSLLNDVGNSHDALEDDDVIDLPKKAVTTIGDVWTLGNHQLLCGSCERLETICHQKEAALMITDPPYGVSYAEKNKFLNTFGKGNRIQVPIENDHHGAEKMSFLWSTWFSSIRPLMKDGACYYVTGPPGELFLPLLLALKESGMASRHVLVWVKNNHVLGRCDYHYKHEPIIYGWVDGAHHKVSNRSEVSVWEIDRPHKSDSHPTMKPVELYARAMRNSSDAGELVLEPFAGSGTGYIAAEQLGRVCKGTELSPAYCDVVVERWQNLTGQKARVKHE